MRVDNWPLALAEFIHSVQRSPFVWGELDCCLFVARTVEAMTGTNPASLFTPYDSEAGAMALLEEHGGFVGLLTHAFGEPMENKALMGRGDVCVVAFGDGSELRCGVCNGPRVVTFDRHGIESATLSAVVKAWSIR